MQTHHTPWTACRSISPGAGCMHFVLHAQAGSTLNQGVWWVSLRSELLAQLRPTLKFVSASLSKSRDRK